MALKAWASSPISSVRLAYSVKRVSNSPRANLLAALLMLLRGSMIRWTVTEHRRMETSRTAAAVTRKSWKVFSRKVRAAVASEATKRMPRGLELVICSRVKGSTV